jgi:hypothetical protein
MGLGQSFRFHYDSRKDIEQFLEGFLKNMQSTKRGELFVITEYEGKKLEFELAIEDYGLYSHRSGEYFELLGCLVEQLTGRFGKIEINGL